jgi:hypothetical protein
VQSLRRMVVRMMARSIETSGCACRSHSA